MQIAFLKLIDTYLGRLICLVFRPLPPSQIVESTTFLIIRPGGIGDSVLLIPTLKAIRKVYPACTIDILAEKRNAASFHLVSGIRNVYLYDTLAGLSSTLRCRYDIVIDTEQWYRLSAVVARFVRAPVKIGFDTNERRRMYTHGVQYDLDVNETENFLTLLKPLGIDCLQTYGNAVLTLPLQSVSRAGQLLQQLCSAPLVVIFSGASIPEKRWGVERFCQVSKRLAEDGYKVVVVGGHEDRVDGDNISGSAGLNLAGMTTLAETAAVISRSSLVISGDSGVLHLAAGLGIPTVSLFGPSSVKKWAPAGSKHIVLHKGLSCSPCSKFGMMSQCPFDARCLKDITPDDVMEAIGYLLPEAPEKKKP
jgi:lipopolysaccharide heptosyltransferase II